MINHSADYGTLYCSFILNYIARVIKKKKKQNYAMYQRYAQIMVTLLCG